MPRLLLTDEYWSKLRPIMLDVGIYDKAGLRLTVEGILYRLRVGCPWRDLPPEFGFWNSVFKRFNDWSEKGKLSEIFSSLASAPDTEWVFIDGSISKAHQPVAAPELANPPALANPLQGTPRRFIWSSILTASP